MKNTDKKIFTVATAHLDTSWLWTFEKTVDTFIPDTLRENFKLFESFPEYKFNFEGSYRYELIEEYYPKDFEMLKGYIADGRWHPCGSCYENGDVNTPSPEALTRNILYGNGYFREKFGIESNDIFLPDCFGFGRALPSIAAHSGLTGFSTQKLTWGGSVDVPFDIGRWTGLDGNGIWCAIKPGDYSKEAGNLRKDKRVLGNLEENIAKDGNPRTFVYHGTGDRGGAPSKESVRNVVKAMEENSTSDLKVFSSTTKEFFDEMEALSPEEKAKIRTFDAELLLTEHGAGSYTSRTVTKRWNRRSELLADAAERFASTAFIQGLAEYPQYVFDKAWKKVISHQFHDDITGTSFEVCYKRSHNDYVQAMNSFSAEYTAAGKAIAGQMDTSFAKGTAVIVSNPVQNSGKRVGAVSVDLTESTLPYVRVYNSKGAEVPSQKKELPGGKIRVTFLAEVSSCAMAVYDVRFSDKESALVTELTVSGNKIENKNLIITIDEKGDISSIYDKKRNKEALKKPIRMAIRNDLHSYDWPAWEVKLQDFNSEPYMYPENPKVTVEENGPALCSVKITRKAGKSTFRQIISLDAESDYVSIKNETDWREEASLLKAEFSVAASNKFAQYDIGFGYTERPTNTERLFEVPAQKWAGIADENGEFGVAIFSDSRTGWDKPDNSTLRLTCIHTPLNNYRWECSQHLLDLGINRYSFAVYPNGGEKGKVIAAADEFCQPMHTFITEKHGGDFGSEYSALKTNNDNVRISALKKAQDSDRIILRVCEYTGAPQKDVEIEFPLPVKEIFEVRGDEIELGSVPVKDGKLCFDMAKFEIRSFALVFDKAASKKADEKQLELNYNAVAITSNKDRNQSTLPAGISVPRELVPGNVLCSGVNYNLDDTGAVLCLGQEIEVDPSYSKVSFLLTSVNGDRDVAFGVGDKKITVRVQDCFEAVGLWDLMASKQTGYIKTQPQMLSFSHTHNADGDLIAKQFYVFKADIPLDGEGRIALPKDEDIIIFAATLTKDSTSFEKGDEHFDRLEKRKFDYSFSKYAVMASGVSAFEKVFDKKFNRTTSRPVKALKMYSKLSLGEAYYFIRNIPALVLYPYRKNKMSKR